MAAKVSALLLAAGSGRRMGRLKQLRPLADRPVFRHRLDSLVASGIAEIDMDTMDDYRFIRHKVEGTA